jgi:hypothetical protein
MMRIYNKRRFVGAMGDMGWAVLILVLGAAVIAVAGFLWIEYGIPEVWLWFRPSERLTDLP